MSFYTKGRLDYFKDYYNSLDKEKQSDMMKSYVGNLVHNILGIESGRKYCEVLAGFLIESGKMKIGTITFEENIDEIELFFEKKKRKSYSKWQRDLLAYLYKKYR